MKETHTTPMESILGTIIERRYLLRDVIGEGGFAEVFEASDTKLGRRVALKILKPHPKPSQREIAHRRFFREAKLAAQISHPDIVTIFDYGQTQDGHPFIVLEHLDGRPLSRLLWHDGPMEPKRAYTLFMKATHAIAAAHDQGVIHRDLKPSNLMIINEGTHIESMKVLDFGIAFFFEEALTRLTSTGQFLGTPEYLAPEYIGEREITPALDVYQLALIFIEMLTGRPLVSFAEPLQCMFAHYNGYVTVPNYLKNSPVGQVLERALSPKPSQRFHNASVFFAALDEIDPATIPSIPEQATPEELGVTRDWESAEVDKFSQSFEQQLAALKHIEQTASIEPLDEAPYRAHHATEADMGHVDEEGTSTSSSQTLRLVGGVGLLVVVCMAAFAIYLDQSKPEVVRLTPSSSPPEQAVVEAPTLPTTYEVRVEVQPAHASIVEGTQELGTGSAALILSRDTPDLRRITVKADGYLSRTQEISRDSPALIEVTLDKAPVVTDPVVASVEARDELKPSPPRKKVTSRDSKKEVAASKKPTTPEEDASKDRTNQPEQTSPEQNKQDVEPKVTFAPFDKLN